MASFDNAIRAWLISMLMGIDVANYPLPVPAIDEVVIRNQFAIFRDGFCPFVVHPPFSVSGRAAEASDKHLDSSRQISFVYENGSLFISKFLHYTDDILSLSREACLETVYRQVAVRIPQLLDSYGMLIFFHAAIVISSAAHLVSDNDVAQEMSWVASRVIMAYYSVGSSNVGIDSSGHFCLFVVFYVFVLVVEKALHVHSIIFEHKAGGVDGNTLTYFEYAGTFATGLASMASAVLVITLTQAGIMQLSIIYRILVTLECLRVATGAFYLIFRIFAVKLHPNHDPHKSFTLKLLIYYINDLLDAGCTIIAIGFGFFLRRRFMALLPVSHARRLLQRVLLIDYPAFSDSATQETNLTY